MNDSLSISGLSKKKKKKKKPQPILETTSRSAPAKKTKTRKLKPLVEEYKAEDMAEVETFYITEASKLLHKFPNNMEELYQCVQALLGVNIPYTNCFDHTTAPFLWFADNFFGFSPVTVAVAPRGGSKTFYGSANHWLKCTLLPGYEGGHAAANEPQAKVASKYLKKMAKNKLYVPLLVRGEVGTYTAKWRNGSIWNISRSSMQGISGQHPHMLTADEIEFWTIAGLKQALGTAIDYDRGGIYIPSVLSFFSTRQRVTGGTFWMMEEAAKRNFTEYVWSIFECMERCKTCFSYTTPVTLADGTSRMIGTLVNKKIKAEVLSYDPDKNGFVSKKVVGWVRKTHSPYNWARIGLKRGKARTLGSRQSPGGAWITPDHEVYTQRGKVAVQNLLATDRILTTHKAPNDIQKQIIDGTLLGDGSLRTPKNKNCNSRYSFAQTISRAEYADYIAEALGSLDVRTYVSEARGRSKQALHVYSKSSPMWHEEYQRWYPKRGKQSIKQVPEDLELTPLVLACWYMDDGSLNVSHGSSRQIKFCTEGFSKSSFWRLFYKMVNLGFKPRALLARNGNHQLVLGERNGDIDKFFNMVAKYIVPCCRYKLTEGYEEFDPSVWETKTAEPYYSEYEVIMSVPSKHERPELAFCLEVEDTHNFVVHGMVVSNCHALDQHPHGSDEQRNQACPLWEDCKGEAGRKCSGWIPRNKVIEMKEREDYVSWQTQYMCSKPASTGLVYPGFEHDYYPLGNYVDPDKIGIGQYDPSLPYMLWVDPSESGTAACLFVQVQTIDGRKRLVGFDEVVVDNCKSTLDFKIAIMDRVMDMGYDMPSYAVPDASRVEAHRDFERGSSTGIGANYSIKCKPPSKKTKNGGVGQEIELTIPIVRRMINANGNRTLLLNPVTCPRHCRAFKVYSYVTNDEGEIVAKNPSKKGSDEMDDIRYGCIRYTQDNGDGGGGSLVTMIAG